MAAVVDFDVYTKFGDVHRSGISSKAGIFEDAFGTSEGLLKLESFIFDVFNKKHPKISKVELNRLVFNLVNDSFEDTNNTVNRAVNSITANIAETIQDSIINNSFTISDFVMLFKNFVTQSKILSEYLGYYTDKVKCGKHSFLSLVTEYLFYNNVINKQYTTVEGMKFLYTIISDIIKRDRNGTIPLDLSKIHSYYQNLSNSLNSKRVEVFNVSIDDNFLTSFGDDTNFVKSLVIELNKNILQYYRLSMQHVPDSKAIKDTHEAIKSIIKTTSYFSNKDAFYNYYLVLLQNRIMSLSTENDVEEEVYEELLKYDRSSTFLKQIGLFIDDFVQSCQYNDIITKIKTKKVTDDYTEKDIEGFTNLKDKGSVRFIVARDGLWESLDDSQYSYNSLPVYIKIAMDVFESFYLGNRHSGRDLKWNLKNSFVIIDFNSSGKEYKIKMSIPQYIVFDRFKEKDSWSAKELSDTLEMNFDELGGIINDFMKAGLMVRDEGDPTDINLKFYIRDDFSHPVDKISLIGGGSAKKDTATSNDNIKFEVIEKITKLLDDDKMEENSLILTVKNLFSNKLSNDKIKECIDLALSNKIISYEMIGVKRFYKMDDSDSE